MRVLYRLILYILIVFATVACVNDKEEPVWSLQPGNRLPDFEVVMSDGRRITTESLKGKHSVIVFFNTSCSDCRRELPEIQKYYWQCLIQSEKQVEFLCISREEDEASVEAYWKENGFTMPFSAQNNRDVFNLFASSGIPRLYEADENLIITKCYETYFYFTKQY